MPALAHRIDFMAFISVSGANPNGDPRRSGIPRTDSSGRGVISTVCIKRKLRDRLAEMGEDIFVSPPEYPGDNLAKRAAALPKGFDYAKRACEKWFDVRCFGQVFAFPGIKSPGIKGAVTIQQAVSLHPVEINQTSITRCISGSQNSCAGSVGFISSVKYGLYVLKGSVNAYTAEKTGFSREDCEKLRQAIIHIFDNDSSAARPAGSMELNRLYWWEHSSALGDHSPAKVFGTVRAELLNSEPLCFEDYRLIHEPLPGLMPEIY